MKIFSCTACGKAGLSKNEIGISKKLIDPNGENLYCLPCCAEYLEVSEQDILDKIEEFKEDGCVMFE